MVLYTTAFQNYHSFSKKIVVNYKQAKKKSLPKDIEIAKTFRDAFNEDMVSFYFNSGVVLYNVYRRPLTNRCTIQIILV